MFENTLIIDTGTRRPWTMLAGLSGQLLALTVLVSLPLVYTDKLPFFRITELHILPPIGRPVPLAEPQATIQPVPAPRRTFTAPDAFTALARIPRTTLIPVDQPEPSVPGDTGPYVLGAAYEPNASPIGIPANPVRVLPPPPERAASDHRAAKAPEKPIERIRVGGDVQAARIIHRVIPVYPPLARQARISGVVQLLGIIGTDGRVQQLRVIKGHPLLVQAARDAVRQWVYHPTLLNGDPVEVVAPIDVHFTLTQ
jgi:protein TonB